MQVIAQVKQGPLGAIGFDTDTKLDTATCAALAAAGMKFALRYLSLEAPSLTDLTAAETETILDSGLALMPVQHVRSPGWTPSATTGETDGTRAASNATSAGLPPGLCLWCDLEGVKGTAADAIAHANAWTAAVRNAGYEPGLYVGAGVPLTATQLFRGLTVTRYWRSFSAVPNVARRGYQMLQLYPETTIAGIRVDLDVIQSDYLGDRPLWVQGGM